MYEYLNMYLLETRKNVSGWIGNQTTLTDYDEENKTKSKQLNLNINWSWDVPLTSNASFGGKKLLNIRDKIKDFFFIEIGNGEAT